MMRVKYQNSHDKTNQSRWTLVKDDVDLDMLLHVNCIMDPTGSCDPLLSASNQSLTSSRDSLSTHQPTPGRASTTLYQSPDEFRPNNPRKSLQDYNYVLGHSTNSIPEYYDDYADMNFTKSRSHPAASIWGSSQSSVDTRTTYIDIDNDYGGRCNNDSDHSDDGCNMTPGIYKVAGFESCMPKSVSMPFRQVTPDPFPELTSNAAVKAGGIVRHESSKSSPSSPLLSRHGDGVEEREQDFSTTSSMQQLSASADSLDNKHVMWTPKVYTKLLVSIYTEEEEGRGWKTVSADEHMPASDACHLLVIKNHAVHDKNWVITERVNKFNLERNLEDHESICQIQKSWGSCHDNKFYFRKDCRKYEVFKSPNQFFPPSMVDVKLEDDDGSLLCRFERYKSILLQNLFYSDSMPDIQGYLIMKEGKRSWLWKKHFFVLRPSGLYYSTKGSSKEPQHLLLFSDLTDVNIYSAIAAKKTLGAPKSHCLCLKAPHSVSDVKELKLLCAEDEQSKLCWMTALRLAKYGNQLKENFRTAMKYEEKLQNIESKDTFPSKNPAGSIKSRVAMDFTGPGGRVVADPNEALGVALAEAHHWRKKVASRTTSSHSPLSGSPTVSGCGLLSENPNASRTGISSGVHMSQPWFHSGISREQAVSLVTKQGLVDGVFLIRESHSVKGAFVLSLAHNHKVKHCQIMPLEHEAQTYYSLDGAHTKFADLIQLVEFYQINAGGLPTTLSHYVTRLL